MPSSGGATWSSHLKSNSGGLFFSTFSDECQINISTQNIHKHKICQSIDNETIVPLHGSLLSACRTNGNVEMGLRMAQRLVKFEANYSTL
ncbi:hypothetical protein Goari_007961 [Gossypium aridum]|uniref:Uncharacterized protein n=1 Tax=Gossypium aridum TaxID=34290 RepID=A0A7J8XSM4_GOSAI|nr:hypothetical protein [Gossypium aridum]